MERHRTGTTVMGICGGFQMLGRSVADPAGIESDTAWIEGLGLLPAATTLTCEKRTRAVRATTAGGVTFGGYEIHVGVTTPGQAAGTVPFATLEDGTTDGMCSRAVIGTYLHGALESAGVCAEIFGVELPEAAGEGCRLSAARPVARAARPAVGAPRFRLSHYLLHYDGTIHMNWERLLEQPTFDLRRSGRFLVADLKEPHHVLSTSVRNGGLIEHVRWLVNHQSCEGSAHLDRHKAITATGLDGYHDRVCEEIGAPAGATAVMGTAANMNYVAVVREADEDVTVTAAVTAGVEGNATAAGEPATWRETDAGMQKVPVYAGTINTMLFISRPLTAAALARVVVTMTEGKSAALHRLAVPSKLHVDLATGTGTDQYCVAAPLGGGKPLTSASPHVKLGELVGSATRQATMEALRWQNGLEASYTRGVFHALGRYGVKEATILRGHRAVPERGRSRAAEEEQQGGVLRAARRRCRARARDGLRSCEVRDASGRRGPGRDGATGREPRRQPRGAGAPLARVPRNPPAARDRRCEDARPQSGRARVVREVANG